MNGSTIRSDFLDKTMDDNRISNIHIGLFVILVYMFSKQGYQGPLVVFAKMVMKEAKISSTATYHKLIRELHDYGYLQYKPSFNNRKGSQIIIQTS
jgi:hypothetical protein